MHAPKSIDFLFHLFSHLHLTRRPMFFYLFVDDFSEFTLIENAIFVPSSYPPASSPSSFPPSLLSAGLIEILFVCLCGMRDENDFVDRKKDDERGEVGEGALFKKKWQRMGNR